MSNKAKFKGRRQSQKAIIALILGIVSLVTLITMIILNGVFYVDGNEVFGFLGIISFILSIIGFVLGFMSLKERDVFVRIPRTSVIVNGFSVIVYFILYIIGLSV